MISIQLPIRTWNTANCRWHWAKKAKIAKQQRQEAFMAARAHGVRMAPPGQFDVCLVRVGKRRMDSDGLAISFKAIRDGIAAAMGIDDGDPRIEWQYGQEIGKAYMVKITIGAGHAL
jgi:hypothetical protein